MQNIYLKKNIKGQKYKKNYIIIKSNDKKFKVFKIIKIFI